MHPLGATFQALINCLKNKHGRTILNIAINNYYDYKEKDQQGSNPQFIAHQVHKGKNHETGNFHTSTFCYSAHYI